MVTCPSCGRDNPEGAQFCNACGARLVAAGREVRKTVTVLFADVTGSTALGERLDAESFRRVMARYFETARGCVERHGGTVEKFIGDAVMAVFGVPTVHEDDALRALRSAAELRDSLSTLNGELERSHGISLQLRVGVNTGEVVTGTEERLATGDAVNVAARLEQAAEPGEILIGDPTRQLALGAIEVEPVEPLAVKGKTQPLVAYRLLRVAEGAPAYERRLDAPLVGRRDELARVRAAFDAAVAERACRLVTVLGPPGIGKSRLAHELASTPADALVLTGRCLPYGDGITYWPLVEIFREAGAEDELVGALSAEGAEEIFWGVRKALERRSRRRPLVLVMEDIHWGEPTLLDLVEHLVDWTRDAPLLLLCLARPELLDEHPGWGRQPNAETLTLEPLSTAEFDELIENLGAHVDAQTRARIEEATGGNPLFIEQLLALRAEGGEVAEVPPTMQALLAARLDALAEAELDVLERASVIGLDFEWEALAELTPDRRRPPGSTLAVLVRKELIRPHEAIEDTFRFRHILIRDAAYERIPKASRSDLHERFADWLDGRGDEFEEIVGYHLEQAHRFVAELGPVDERGRMLAERAAEHLAASGLRAFSRGDMAAAVNLLGRAGTLFGPEDPRRLRLLPSMGRGLIELGDWDGAMALLSEACDTAQRVGERIAAAEASVWLWYLRLHREAQWKHEDVERALDEAIRAFDELHHARGIAMALNLAGWMRIWRGEAEGAIADLERAAQHARAAGDRAQEAEALRGMVVAIGSGPMPASVGIARLEALDTPARGNPRLDAGILAWRAWLEAMCGRFDVAREMIRRAAELAEEFGFEMMLNGNVRRLAGVIELLAGDPAAAERALRPACEMLERMGDMGHLATVAPFFADAVYAQGRGEEAARWIDLSAGGIVEDDSDGQIGWRRTKARLLAQRGELAEAERLARDAVALAQRSDDIETRGRVFADLAEVLRIAGRGEEAAAALDDAIRLYEQKGNVVAAAALRARLAGRPAQPV